MIQTAAPWPAHQLREARTILADVAHHPDTRVALAARVVIVHSQDEVERNDATELRRLLDPIPQRGTSLATCRQRGVA